MHPTSVEIIAGITWMVELLGSITAALSTKAFALAAPTARQV